MVAVSIIIPAYNHGRYLQNTINSLKGGLTDLGIMPGQTFQDFEIILVDDASTDETVDIGPAFDDAWENVRYFRHSENKGTAAANNTGISNAKGEYITILCADDMMESNRIERLYRVAKDCPHNVVYDDMSEFTNGRRLKQWPMRDYDFEQLIYRNMMHAGIFYPKVAWEETGGYPEIMSHGREDWAMAVALGRIGWCGVHIPEPLYLYRREGQNRSLGNVNRKWQEFFLGQLQSLYPEIYAGERMKMCCGRENGKINRRKQSRSKKNTIMDLELALANSEYSEQQRACIRQTLQRARIDTMRKLENAPGQLGHVCGVDIYQLVQHIRDWSLEEVS